MRLVKGAYWDAETVHAARRRLASRRCSSTRTRPTPTTSAAPACSTTTTARCGPPSAATTCARSPTPSATPGSAGIPDHGFEVQLLYGMAEPVHAAIKRLGLRLRVYGPVGELVPGMAYLVRRLLENTSNECFVRHRFAEGRRPRRRSSRRRTSTTSRARRSRPAVAPTDAAGADARTRPSRSGSGGGRRPGPAFARGGRPGRETTLGHRGARAHRRRAGAHRGHDRLGRPGPPRPGGRHLGVVHRRPTPTPRWPPRCAAAPAWRRTPGRRAGRAAVPGRRSGCAQRRDELAALECFEAGKPWDQADADVCEAIDFCEYYGREMLRLDGGAADLVQSPPGEANRLTYQGKGVTAVIAPWNFPLAIPCGMTVAALAAGNPVILKPAEQTPAVAWRLVEALRGRRGRRPGCSSSSPGSGEEVGARLVEHPDVAVIAFTGSQGGRPRDQPGRRHARSPASTTSRRWSPSWAARTR